jgi:hypothetical protein
MRKLFFVLTLLLSVSSFSQKKSVYLSLGKPWFPDKDSNLRNFSIGVNYQNKFSQSFAFDIALDYAQSDNFPSFYNNGNELNDFLLNQKYNDIYANSLWSKITTINLGGKLNYLFVNNNKFVFSFNVGFGYSLTESSLHNLKEWTYNAESGEILSYENETISDNLNTFNYSLGIQFQYTFYKNYFIGINPYYLNTIGENKVNTIPVYPNFYNLTFIIGKKF